MKTEHEELPSGKSILRQFDDAGRLTEETHGYGMLDIAIKMRFANGTKVEETYFVRRQLVSRSRYEKARQKYADMPAADDSLEDWGADLFKACSASATSTVRPPENASQILGQLARSTPSASR